MLLAAWDGADEQIGAQMDPQTLTNLFSCTFSPDPNVQKRAELEIRKVCNALCEDGQ